MSHWEAGRVLRRRVGGLVGFAFLVAACGDDETAAPGPTRTPAPVQPTRTPAPAPVNYGAMARRLVIPLGPLIVAVRERSTATIPGRLAAFNEVAEPVLAAIQGDMSTEANRLHSAITNVRDGTARGDVATLERERMTLLGIR